MNSVNPGAEAGNQGMERALCLIFLCLLAAVFLGDRALLLHKRHASAEMHGDTTFVFQPYKPDADMARTCYGDLAEMLVAPQLIRAYGVKNTCSVQSDKNGFAAPRGATLENSRVVVAGDSFTGGPRLEDTVAGMLNAGSGAEPLRAYNMGVPGSAARSLAAFLRLFPEVPNPSLTGNRKLLVIVLSKRSLTGESVESAQALGSYSDKKLKKKILARRISQALPDALIASATDDSQIAGMSATLAGGVQYALGRFEVPDSVTIGRRKMLFLTQEVAMSAQPPGRDSLLAFANVMLFMRDQAARRGFQVLVLMVPDKSDVHPGYLPDGLDASGAGAAAYFQAVESELSSRGVPALNLLPLMRAQALACGCLLYPREETHWNSRGKRVAVHALEEYVRSHLPH